MSNQNDTKARFGYQPTWDKQREKQEEVAENYYARVHGHVEQFEPEPNPKGEDDG